MRLLLFSVVSFSVIFLIGFIQSVTADHLESGTGLFVTESKTNLITSKNTNYQIHLQMVIRNGDGQLINVLENNIGAYIPHKITDDIFDTEMGKKEIITIDNIKYEKVQYTFSPTLEQRWLSMYPIFEEIPIKIKVEGLAKGKIFSVIKDHSIWKIHYCADFSNIGHDGLQCIPVFQVLVPTITLEPGDVVTHQWTILRDLN